MEKEIERLKRFIVFSWMLLLFVFIGIVLYASIQYKHVNNLLIAEQAKLSKPIKGIDGLPGSQGLQGMPGLPGKDGKDGESAVSTTTIVEKPTTTIIQQNIPTPGEKGDRGEQGSPGREIELGSQDGKIVWHYSGDEAWQQLIEVTP